MSKSSKRKIIISILFGVFAAGLLASSAALAIDTGIEYGTYTGLGTEDFRVTVMKIVRVALGFLGVLAIAIILYGGFVWMTSGGNPEKIDKAKKILVSAVIGLVIIFTSVMIASFIINRLSEATGVEGLEECENPGQTQTCIIPSLPACPAQRICQSNNYWGACQPIDPNDPRCFEFYANQCVITNLSPKGPNIPINSVAKITFNHPNIQGVVLKDNVKIIKDNVSTGDIIDITENINNNIIELIPENSCPEPHQDKKCFSPNTKYFILLEERLYGTSVECGGYKLNCIQYPVGTSCLAEFITGGYDEEPPSGYIIEDQICQSEESQLRAFASDNYGIDSVSFSSGGNIIGTDYEVENNGIAAVNWDTSGYSAESTVTVDATISDYAGYNLDISHDFIIHLGHCCNNIKDEDEQDVDCGGSCEACLPVISWISPNNGKAGNLITISGKRFGNLQGSGKVYFTSSTGLDLEAQMPSSVNSACTNNWSDNQIIVVVPSDALDGPIKVVTDSGQSDQTNDSRGSKIPDFDLNDTVRPGLCNVVNNTTNQPVGQFDDPITVQGINFSIDSRIYFGTVLTGFEDMTLGGNITINGLKVALVEPGLVGVRVKDGLEYSNPFSFQVNPDGQRPIIYDFSPKVAAAGSYVTIIGANFGDSKIAGSHVFFGSTEAEYDFPPECQNTYWSQSQIIVKVPSGLADGSYNLSVEVNSITASASESFTADQDEARPNICAVVPDNGPANTDIIIYGESSSFTDVNKVNFYQNVFALPSSVNPQIAAKVPVGSMTGPITAETSDGKISNSLDFTVGSCVLGSCGPAKECCQTGQYEGICMPQGGCSGFPTDASYMWDFTTGQRPGPCSRDIGECQPDDILCPMNQICNTINCECELKPTTQFECSENPLTCTPSDNFCPPNKYCNTDCTCIDRVPCNHYVCSNDPNRYCDNGLGGGDITLCAGEGVSCIVKPVCEPNQNVCKTIGLDWYCQSTDCFCHKGIPCDGEPESVSSCEPNHNICKQLDSSFICDEDACICVTGELATEASYFWSFNSFLFGPTVVDECNRRPDCSKVCALDRTVSCTEDSDCISGAENIGPCIKAFSSPSPKFERDGAVHVNSIVSASFTEKIIDSTLLQKDAAGNFVNLKLLSCNAAGASCTNLNTNTKNISIFTWNYGTIESEGFILDFINPDSTYVRNKVYRVVLKDTIIGESGYPLAGLNYDSNGDAVLDSYSWIFKTLDTYKKGDIGCVGCQPGNKTLYAQYNGNCNENDLDCQNYIGNGWDQDYVCVLLDPKSYQWNWQLPTEDIKRRASIWDSSNPQSAFPSDTVKLQYTGINEIKTYARLDTSLTDWVKVKVEVTNVDPAAYQYGDNICDLHVDLTTPVVVKRWPDCGAACLNSRVGAAFSRPMNKSTITSGGAGNSMILYACADNADCRPGYGVCGDGKFCSALNPCSGGSCQSLYYDPTAIPIQMDGGIPLVVNGWSNSYLADPTCFCLNSAWTYDACPSAQRYCLLPNTYYRVILHNTIQSNEGKPLGGLNYDDALWSGLSGLDSHSWVFLTSATMCMPGRVDVLPDVNFMEIDEIDLYSSSAFAAPDSCDPQGQPLISSSFVWDWQSTKCEVADLLSNIPPFGYLNIHDFGNNLCTLTENYDTLRNGCGNSVVDPGEDCDDGNISSGDGCSGIDPANFLSHITGSCQKEGLAACSPGFTVKCCGNGKIEYGEDCDDGNISSGDYCSERCLWEGNSNYFSVCGNGIVEENETCDNGNEPNGNDFDGCTNICLKSGMIDPLRPYLCGNNQIDNGEECDDNDLRGYCSGNPNVRCPINVSTGQDCGGGHGVCVNISRSTDGCTGIYQNATEPNDPPQVDCSTLSETECKNIDLTDLNNNNYKWCYWTGFACRVRPCIDESDNNKGTMNYNIPVCGNGRVEYGEECDFGSKCQNTYGGISDCTKANEASVCKAGVCGQDVCQQTGTEGFIACTPGQATCKDSVCSLPMNAQYGFCGPDCLKTGSQFNDRSRQLVNALFDGQTEIRAWTTIDSNVFGSGDLYVGNYIPEGMFGIIEKWPNCDWACLNAAMGARFNLPIDAATVVKSDYSIPTIADNVFLYFCGPNNNCDITGKQPIPARVDSDSIILTPADTFRIYLPNWYNPVDHDQDPLTSPIASLIPNSYYRVVVRNRVKSMSGEYMNWQLNFDDPFYTPNSAVFPEYISGQPDSHSWVFKTQSEFNLCDLDKVKVRPSSAFLEEGGNRLRYFSQPYSAPDQCDSSGQMLNSYLFNWHWDDVEITPGSSYPGGANIKTYNAPTWGNLKGDSSNWKQLIDGCPNGMIEPGEDCDFGLFPITGCSNNCLWNGNTTDCGNGQIDPGEECDDSNTASNDGCSSICLREGNTNYDISICGNGILEGDEVCDSGNEPNNDDSDGCTNICTLSGSIPGVDSLCGDGAVGKGESCDDGERGQNAATPIISNDGCTGFDNYSVFACTTFTTKQACEEIDYNNRFQSNLAWCYWSGTGCYPRPCLSENSTGSQFYPKNTPSCGNGKIDNFEECDDGGWCQDAGGNWIHCSSHDRSNCVDNCRPYNGFCSISLEPSDSGIGSACSATGVCRERGGANYCFVSDSMAYNIGACLIGSPCTVTNGMIISDGCSNRCLNNGSAAKDNLKDPYQIAESVLNIGTFPEVKEEIRAWSNSRPEALMLPGELKIIKSSGVPFRVIGHQPKQNAQNQCRNVAIWAVFSRPLNTDTLSNFKVCPGGGPASCSAVNLVKSYSYRTVLGKCISNSCHYPKADNPAAPLPSSYCQTNSDCLGSQVLVTALDTPTGFLAEFTSYRVDVSEVKSSANETPPGPAGYENIWQFQTNDNFCACDYIGVVVNNTSAGEQTVSDSFTCAGNACGTNTTSTLDDDVAASVAGNQHLYEATCYDVGSLQDDIIPLNTAGLEFTWGQFDPDGLIYLTDHTLLDTSGNNLYYVTPGEDSGVPGGKNGEAQVNVSAKQYVLFDGSAFCDPSAVPPYVCEGATIPCNPSSSPACATGACVPYCMPFAAAEQSIDVTVFICENPWPQAGNFPYNDNDSNSFVLPDTNFNMYYCRDKGDAGPSDDLPGLIDGPVVGSSGHTLPGDNTIKDLIFHVGSTQTGNLIGVKVMKNPLNLSPETWYRSGFCGGTAKFESLCFSDSDCFRVNDPSLVVYWPFEETSGSVVNDLTGYANNGKMKKAPPSGTIDQEVKWFTGKFGNGIRFQSAEYDFVQSDRNDINFGTTGELTYSAWIKVEKYPPAGIYSKIISKRTSISNENFHFLGLATVASNKKTIYAGIADSNGTDFLSTNDIRYEIPVGQWHHVALTFNNLDHTAKIYVDGILQVSKQKNDEYLVDFNAPLAVGRDSDLATNYFDGVIDEVRIYNRSLTADEIRLLAESSERKCIMNVPVQGSPQSAIIDGYKAIIDGRTTYVGAANRNNNNLYSNIYLISYDQNAGADTVEIVNRILDQTGQAGKWHFNADFDNDRVCGNGYYFGTDLVCDGTKIGKYNNYDCFLDYPTQGQCETPASVADGCFWNTEGNPPRCSGRLCEPYYCLNDFDCPDLNCSADKEQVIRDTLRFGDLRDIQISLERYKRQNGIFPKLSAGTYISGTTFSVWPSWSQTLGNELSASLYVDPLNLFKGCTSGFFCDYNKNGQIDSTETESCTLGNINNCGSKPVLCRSNDPETETTCWNELESEFGCPADMFAYAYKPAEDGLSYNLYTNMEYEGPGSWRTANPPNLYELPTSFVSPECKKLDFEINRSVPFGGLTPVECVVKFCWHGTGFYGNGSILCTADADCSLGGPNAICIGDGDADGYCDDQDNCNPKTHCANPASCYNPDQKDSGGTVGLGDVCDPLCSGDIDNDGVCDENDNCPIAWNPANQDCGHPGSGGTISNRYDATTFQCDYDDDGYGDACDFCTDIDLDGYWDFDTGANDQNICPEDNCKAFYNDCMIVASDYKFEVILLNDVSTSMGTCPDTTHSHTKYYDIDNDFKIPVIEKRLDNRCTATSTAGVGCSEARYCDTNANYYIQGNEFFSPCTGPADCIGSPCINGGQICKLPDEMKINKLKEALPVAIDGIFDLSPEVKLATIRYSGHQNAGCWLNTPDFLVDTGAWTNKCANNYWIGADCNQTTSCGTITCGTSPAACNASGLNCPGDLCNSSRQAELKKYINDFYIHGGETNLLNAIDYIKNVIFNLPAEERTIRIIIVMGDGASDDAGNGAFDDLKADNVLVYSIAYGTEATEKLLEFSSNPSTCTQCNPTLGSGCNFCFMGNDINNLYNMVISSISAPISPCHNRMQIDYDNDGIGYICDQCIDFDKDGLGDYTFFTEDIDITNVPPEYQNHFKGCQGELLLFTELSNSPESDLDNCPGGPYGAICKDEYGIDLPSCYNPPEGLWIDKTGVVHSDQQKDFNLNLKGDICDSSGNGMLDPGEECDCGYDPELLPKLSGTGENEHLCTKINEVQCIPLPGYNTECWWCQNSIWRQIIGEGFGNGEIDPGEQCDCGTDPANLPINQSWGQCESINNTECGDGTYRAACCSYCVTPGIVVSNGRIGGCCGDGVADLTNESCDKPAVGTAGCDASCAQVTGWYCSAALNVCIFPGTPSTHPGNWTCMGTPVDCSPPGCNQTYSSTCSYTGAYSTDFGVSDISGNISCNPAINNGCCEGVEDINNEYNCPLKHGDTIVLQHNTSNRFLEHADSEDMAVWKVETGYDSTKAPIIVEKADLSTSDIILTTDEFYLKNKSRNQYLNKDSKFNATDVGGALKLQMYDESGDTTILREIKRDNTVYIYSSDKNKYFDHLSTCHDQKCKLKWGNPNGIIIRKLP